MSEKRVGASAGLFIASFVLAASSAASLRAQVEIAGSLLVDLDAEDASAGTEIWANLAPDSIGDFDRVGGPLVEEVEGVTAVTFNPTDVLDSYQSQLDAPDGLIGLDPTRSIEAWVFNPQIASEETILAWGRRGGPNGTNMSFNYGTHPLFGAIGHWGGDGPDIGWNDGGGAPPAGRWHHLVYTYDGATTRVYNDGCFAGEVYCNTEDLGLGTIDTFGPSKITLAAQLEPDGLTLNFGLRGTLSIAKLRIHDEVLTPEQVRKNFDEECPKYCPPPGLCECVNCPAGNDFHFKGKAKYVRQLRFDAVPPATGLAVAAPAGATIDASGRLEYALPDPQPASFQVKVQCTNAPGTADFTWTVTLVDPPPRADIAVAEELLVDLDAAHESAGEGLWLNAGSLSDFLEIGDPVLGAQGPESSPAVDFNSTATLDAYQCLELPPAGIVGLDPTRSIEAWVFNPDIPAEETILSWGRRGGPNGTNMSFNYGIHNLYGAVGHWGGDGPDLGWNNAGGAPEPGLWHHLVYTYDGETTRVYSDGLLQNSEFLGAGTINTFGDTPIALAAQYDDATSLNFGLRGALSLGQVRIHDGVLSPAQIFRNFLAENDRYGVPDPDVVPPEFVNPPGDGTFCASEDVYAARLQATGTPPPVLSVVAPAGATIDDTGRFTYDIPDPAPASFAVTVKATNQAGEATATWTLTRQDISNELQIAGDLLVDLDARDPSAGTDAWSNGGGVLSEFVKVGNPVVVSRLGVKGVSFNEGRSGDSYESLDPAPEGIVGTDPTRSIEVWVYNEAIPSEETILSWGKRGGPNGSNMSFNYGSHQLYGAVGHWGGDGPDLGWNNGGGAPDAGQWHHLVYTYDGETTRVYADGCIADTAYCNSELLGPGIINTFPEPKISLAQQHEADGAVFTTALQGSLVLSKVRIHDEVLSLCQVQSNYEVELPLYEVPCPQPGSPDFADTHCLGIVVRETGAGFGPTHRVTATAADDTGDPVLYTFTASNAGGLLRTVGPQGGNEGAFILRNLQGPFIFTVTVDDRPDCDDAAADSTCRFPPPLPPEVCDNQADDDQDGKADCDDEDCAEFPACKVVVPVFHRGDADNNAELQLTDAIRVLGFLFLGGAPPTCMDAGDADGNNQLQLTDAIRILGYLFLGGVAPESPGPPPNDCGPDNDATTLGCETYTSCG
ncbi:MAG: laminin G domain-containing protein [Planctomycetes bacterium]|nr:laminin G domain-containing protein [Planctomycetota bacterium]